MDLFALRRVLAEKRLDGTREGAALLGCSVSYLGGLASGRRATEEQALRISKKFGVTIDDLFIPVQS